jgi:electron transfer flavoprotein alpha/beta subunit
MAITFESVEDFIEEARRLMDQGSSVVDQTFAILSGEDAEDMNANALRYGRDVLATIAHNVTDEGEFAEAIERLNEAMLVAAA